MCKKFLERRYQQIPNIGKKDEIEKFSKKKRKMDENMKENKNNVFHPERMNRKYFKSRLAYNRGL